MDEATKDVEGQPPATTDATEKGLQSAPDAPNSCAAPAKPQSTYIALKFAEWREGIHARDRTFASRLGWAAPALILLIGGGAALYYHLRVVAALGWFAAWILGAIYCILLCSSAWMFYSAWRERALALAAMRRPLAVVLLAGYLLLVQEQVRELGISQMTDNSGLLLPVALCVALVFCALNIWHSARLGVWNALENGWIGQPPPHWQRDPHKPNRHISTDETPWVFWGPRFLGVCAHLLAAINLAFTAQKQPEFSSTNVFLFESGYTFNPLAWIAVLVIATITFAVFRFDQFALSEKSPTPAKRLKTLSATLHRNKKKSAAGWIMLVGSPVTIIALVIQLSDVRFSGFLWGTVAISWSAVFYLTVISALGVKRPLGPENDLAARRKDDLDEQRAFLRWTHGLLLCTVPFVAWAILSPPSFGRTFGSFVTVVFALGTLLCVLNELEWLTVWATTRLFGKAAKPQVFRAYSIAFVIAFCVVNAWLFPFHQVRRCKADTCGDKAVAATLADTPWSDPRLNVEQAARLWYLQAKEAYKNAHGSGEVPMLIVAAAGGGIRAAYWTAAALDKLDMDLRDRHDAGFAGIGKSKATGVRPYLFAISGVSGGSVGAAAFAAALAARDKTSDAEKGCDGDENGQPMATAFLTQDFLAPALASLLFRDPFSSLGPGTTEDRAAALEMALEQASGDRLGRPFLSLFNAQATFCKGEPRSTWRPILLLNGTHEETGKRIIASHVRVERDVFVDAFDELQLLGGDVRASTAAVNSARFFYVSPPGDLGHNQGSVIDGGYFENFGALTAQEIAQAAEQALKDETPKVKVVVLMISSDPTLYDANAVVRITSGNNDCLVSATEKDPSNPKGAPNYLPPHKEEFGNPFLNDVDGPLLGIKNVREAHGSRAAAELALYVCSKYNGVSPAATAYKAKDSSSIIPTQAKSDRPYFAHLAMCKKDNVKDAATAGGKGINFTIDPPLGWMLSKSTRENLDELYEHCGNSKQLEQLEAALR